MVSVNVGLPKGVKSCPICGKLMSEKKKHECHLQSLRRYKLQDKIVRMYYEGYSIKQIAETVNLSQTTIKKMFKKLGVKTRRRGTRGRTIHIPKNPAILGYIAGLFDGDGGAREITSKLRKGRVWGLEVYIDNTNYDVIKWLAKTLKSGRVFRVKRKNKNPKWKDAYRFQIASVMDCYLFLKSIYPYLIIKKELVNELLKKADEMLYLECGVSLR